MIGLIVPALNPPATLADLVAELLTIPSTRIVVVDDGSSDQSMFKALAVPNLVTVVHHDRNCGKGEALKTGIRHLVADDLIDTIVTVDADGQHLARDVRAVCNVARSAPQALVLGTRALDKDVPAKSILGNRLIRVGLKLVADEDFRDSQTGLRAFSREFAERCLEIKSNRYGFELAMLLLAKKLGTAIEETDITTVYIDGNRATHFRPLRDSTNVFLVLMRFSMISLASFVFDILLFALLHHATDAIMFSTYAARVLSGAFNFACVQRFVFWCGDTHSMLFQATAYVTLAFVIATASGSGVSFLSGATGIAPALVKLGMDPCLFFVSFAVQRYVSQAMRR